MVKVLTTSLFFALLRKKIEPSLSTLYLLKALKNLDFLTIAFRTVFVSYMRQCINNPSLTSYVEEPKQLHYLNPTLDLNKELYRKLKSNLRTSH